METKTFGLQGRCFITELQPFPKVNFGNPKGLLLLCNTVCQSDGFAGGESSLALLILVAPAKLVLILQQQHPAKSVWVLVPIADENLSQAGEGSGKVKFLEVCLC